MQKPAVIDVASLQKLRERREALRGFEPFPYSERLESVMVRPVLTCAPGDTTTAALRMMVDYGVSSLVVVDPDKTPIGIITERDMIRSLAERGEIAGAGVSDLMTRDPVTLSPTDTVWRAMYVLSSRGIKHLPIVENDRPVGMVTLRQLLQLRYPEPMTMIEAISQATDFDALRVIKDEIPRLATSRLGMGMRAYQVVITISLIHQEIHRRAFDLALAATGEPPVPFCLLLTGSHGRMETLLTSDQDHALILANGEDVDADAEADTFFGEVAARFVDALERIGFPRCDGDVMSTNPIWRKTLFDWKRQLEHWIRRQVPELGRYLTVFFDAQAVHGDETLFVNLGDHAFDLLGRHHELLRILHEEEGSHRVPTGLLGRFITERSGEHRGQLDIKRSGLIFVVEGVRILALMHAVRETGTLARISRLVADGHIHPEDGEYFEAAYRFLLHFALDAQVSKLARHERPSTWLDPSDLSQREREVLRHAYKAVSSLQKLIASEFGELVL